MAKRDTNDYTLDPTLDFLRLLWGIEHGLQRMSKRMEASIGITGPQRLVLRLVGRFPDLAAGELADLVRLHPSTITGILQRLVDRGLLQRDRDADDNRRIRLRLKPSASAYTRIARGTVEHAVKQALSGMALRQTEGAKVVLAAVAAALQDANERPGRPEAAEPSARKVRVSGPAKRRRPARADKQQRR